MRVRRSTPVSVRPERVAAQHGDKGAHPSPLEQQLAFDHLLAAFARAVGAPPATRWHWLEAAHVLGQTRLSLHWRSHTAMLRYALQQRDLREAAGQLLRLALVPLGHALARLPMGNIGRARVSAFAPMAPRTDITPLIDEALAATARVRVLNENRQSRSTSKLKQLSNEE